jgi:hypothetical protein
MPCSVDVRLCGIFDIVGPARKDTHDNNVHVKRKRENQLASAISIPGGKGRRGGGHNGRKKLA